VSVAGNFIATHRHLLREMMNMKLRKAVLLAAVAPLLLLTGCASTPAVEISNPWVRASDYSDHIGGMTGVFFEVKNNSSETITLVGGSAEIAEMVEIHEIVMTGGEMVMQKKDGGISIEPGQTHVLEMGGDHVMLMNLKQAIVAGDVLSVTLDFEGTEDVTLEDLVAKPSDGGDETYHNENMDH
jgi:copper(I)-binding protein